MLKNLQKTTNVRPFIGIMYGTPKVGKTTFGSHMPESLFFNIDDGLDGIPSAKYPVAPEENPPREVFKNIHEVLKALDVVLREDHDFKSLIIDSLSSLERLIWEQVARENSVREIAAIPYGKGYDMAGPYWDQIRGYLGAIRERRGMMVLLLGHAEVKQFRDPMADVYDRYNLKMHEKQRAIFTEWADMILFADQEVLTVAQDIGFKRTANKAIGGNRVIYTIEDPKYVAGNRYGLPAKVPLDWGIFWQTFLRSASSKASQEASKKLQEEAVTEQSETVQTQPTQPE